MLTILCYYYDISNSRVQNVGNDAGDEEEALHGLHMVRVRNFDVIMLRGE